MWCRYMYFSESSLFQKLEETKVHFFEILKAKKVRTLKFRKNWQNFAALSWKYRVERREISPTNH